MKVLVYSDLHLEFDHGWVLPEECRDGDILILAGDIVVLDNPDPLASLLKDWKKPVIYIPGNHEYYSQQPMELENQSIKGWLADKVPNVRLLLDEDISIDGIHFFGGTMWTDFDQGNAVAIRYAQENMSDFELILAPDAQGLTPLLSTYLHQEFKTKLLAWLESDLSGPRIIVTHHAPVLNPNTKYGKSPLWPAFNSLDMREVIEQHKIDYWIYGHTHECDNQLIGNTRIISNQLGYPDRCGGYECHGFDPLGRPIHF